MREQSEKNLPYLGENSVHGSDGETTAAFEISYFFSGLEMVG